MFRPDFLRDYQALAGRHDAEKVPESPLHFIIFINLISDESLHVAVRGPQPWERRHEAAGDIWLVNFSRINFNRFASF